MDVGNQMVGPGTRHVGHDVPEGVFRWQAGVN
jgi:hypothetical protein